MHRNELLSVFKARGRIVIVGASLAGLTAAETLRAEGFTGSLTIIGDEPEMPYDRPPLSKSVLTGWLAAENTDLPRWETVEGVDWRLGVAATGLDLRAKRVHLADGRNAEYDRLMIATGTRARPWTNPAEAVLDGVFTVRTRSDAARLRQRHAHGPNRVLVIGGGFTGSEIASCCRELGLAVTLAELGPAPLAGVLGSVIAERMAQLQRQHGVDLRCGMTVTSRRAMTEDACNVFCDDSIDGQGATAGVARDTEGSHFVAGDVARFPHPLYDYQFMALEHWGNAVAQAQIAAHNMSCLPTERRAHVAVPAFWSNQFGINIKSVGVPTGADEVMIAQGSLEEACCVAVYGKNARLVAAVNFDQGKWLEAYQRLIEQAAPFPLRQRGVDWPTYADPVPAGFPEPRALHLEETVVLTGYDPNQKEVEWISRRHARETAQVAAAR